MITQGKLNLRETRFASHTAAAETDSAEDRLGKWTERLRPAQQSACPSTGTPCSSLYIGGTARMEQNDHPPTPHGIEHPNRVRTITSRIPLPRN